MGKNFFFLMEPCLYCGSVFEWMLEQFEDDGGDWPSENSSGGEKEA